MLLMLLLNNEHAKEAGCCKCTVYMQMKLIMGLWGLSTLIEDGISVFESHLTDSAVVGLIHSY